MEGAGWSRPSLTIAVMCFPCRCNGWIIVSAGILLIRWEALRLVRRAAERQVR